MIFYAKAQMRAGGIVSPVRKSIGTGGTHRWVWLLVPVLIVAALEVLASLRRPQLPGWSGPNATRSLMDAHPTRLWGMAEGDDIMNAQGSTASVNEFGFRGPSPDLPKPEGRKRILTTGDSSFFGFGVNDDEVFTHRLQQQMADRGHDVDVLNLGIGGYTIAQHKLFLEEVGWSLDPDLLILANVWSDNTWDTFRDEDLIHSNRFASANPLTRSALVKLFASWWFGRQDTEEAKLVVWNAADGWPTDKVRRVPLKRWMALYEEIILEAAERGVGVVLVKPTNSFLLSGTHDGPPPAWTPYFESLEFLSEHFKIPLVDVTEAYHRTMASGTKATDLLWDKMHPTSLGHQVLADAVQETLVRSGWPQKVLDPVKRPYDGPEVKDVPNPEWTDDAGAGSPQMKLFEMSSEERAALDAKARIRTVMGHPDRQGQDPPDGAVSPGVQPTASPPSDGHVPIEPLPGWSLRMDIQGGDAPYFIKAVDSEGRTVGSARVGKPGALSLNMPGHALRVTVTIKDGNGEVIEQGATPESSQLSWDLGR